MCLPIFSTNSSLVWFQKILSKDVSTSKESQISAFADKCLRTLALQSVKVSDKTVDAVLQSAQICLQKSSCWNSASADGDFSKSVKYFQVIIINSVERVRLCI